MVQSRGIVVVPTYNERPNLEPLVAAIRKQVPGIHVLIVDDNSPDGTGRLADELAARYPGSVFTLHRPAKQGLGRAYTHAFRVLCGDNYDYIVQMDADFSHDPAYLPSLIEALEDHDLAMGSRYLRGVSVVNWDFKRLVLSKAASHYVRLVAGLPLKDATGGFRAWRTSALRSLDLDHVFSQGYLFQVEMAWRTHRQGLRVVEVPIIFYERRLGQSKVDLRIIWEAAVGVLRLRFMRRPHARAATAEPQKAAR